MRLNEKLKMNLESSLKINIISFNILAFMICSPVYADPVIAGEILPPASATLITEPDLIKRIGVGREEDPVWCYSNDANAILISAPGRERDKCELKLSQQKEKLEASYKLELGALKIELDSKTKEYNKILAIKDKEIQELTEAALKRPNDYSLWWASGGVAVGVLTTLAIMFAVK